jgi:hypothetical protein
MSKKVYVLSVQPDPNGPVFGRLASPTDFQNSQNYAHSHIEEIVKDALLAGSTNPQVSGFNAAVGTGLTVAMQPGAAIDVDGTSYDSDYSGATLTLQHAAADPSHARIDLIYATFEKDAPSLAQFVEFRELRTQAELEAGVNPYIPTQFNEPTELHTRSDLAVLTGVPASSPTVPATPQGAIPLWQVHVAANQTQLAGGDLTDVRNKIVSLYMVAQGAGSSGAFIKADGSVAFTGDQSMGGNKLTNLGTPVNAGDAVSLSYLQTQIFGLEWKQNCRVATTANLSSLSGLLTVDGVTLIPGDRVLVKNQSAPAANGIYVAQSGAWVRSTDTSTWLSLVSAVTVIDEGTANHDSCWNCTVDRGGTLGSSAVVWSAFTFNVPLATESTDGLMSHLDKLALDIGGPWKPSARAASTANISSLSGLLTVDGIVLIASDRVLVKNQSNAPDNGIYVAASGAWSRAVDAAAWNSLVSAVVTVDEGTTNHDTTWECGADRGGTLGATAVNWSTFSGTTYGLATESVDGLMSHTDKTILDDATEAPTASALMARDPQGKFRAVGATLLGSGYVPLLVLANAGGNSAVFGTEFDPNSNAPGFTIRDNSGVVALRLNGGNVSIPGSLTKGSGSFLIDHPLDPLNKNLEHSFIEGPKRDLIYRGRALLVKGRAVVPIDEACGMTPGTFAALTQDPQAFAWNQSDDFDNFDQVRAAVRDGEILIRCSNFEASFDVGWMIIAERRDAHVLSLKSTDADGHLIVESDKVVVADL